MSYIIDTNKYQVWFQDTDPDTGWVTKRIYQRHIK